MILGFLVIIVGIVFLLRNLGLIVLPATFWSLLYPVVLIIIGIYLVLGAQKMKKYWDWIVQKFLKKDKDRS